MHKAENRNAPNLWGWVIGAAAGLVAFGVLVIVGEFDLMPASAMGAGVALIVGLILGMPWGARPKGPLQVSGEAAGVGAPEPAPSAPAAALSGASPASPQTAPQAPVAEAMAQPAAVMSAPVPDAPAAAKPAAKPRATKAKAAGPERLAAPRKGRADDLKEIEGIGPAMEKLVNSLGFYHYDQIASWTDADVAVVDAEMKSFKGRITRDRWVAQAKIIVAEGLEAFRERAKSNNY